MSAIWYDHKMPSFLGIAPSYSFHELPEIHQEVPTPYAAAMAEIKAREMLLGAGWVEHNTELAHRFWEHKKPWWL
jgi:hypothetical protein